jgi:hypothetical protein
VVYDQTNPDVDFVVLKEWTMEDVIQKNLSDAVIRSELAI